MTFYAIDIEGLVTLGLVSDELPEGAIEISGELFSAAAEAVADGAVLSIVDDELVIPPLRWFHYVDLTFPDSPIPGFRCSYNELPGLIEITAEQHAEALEALNNRGASSEIVAGEMVITERPAPTLSELKVARVAALDAAFTVHAASITAHYPSAELLSFDKQEKEARAWLIDDETPTPFLSAIATAEGVSLAAKVAEVIDKADEFEEFMAHAIGTRHAIKGLINAAVDEEALQDVVIEFGA